MRFNPSNLVVEQLCSVRGFLYELMEPILFAERLMETAQGQIAQGVNNHIFVVRTNLVVKVFRRSV